MIVKYNNAEKEWTPKEFRIMFENKAEFDIILELFSMTITIPELVYGVDGNRGENEDKKTLLNQLFRDFYSGLSKGDK